MTAETIFSAPYSFSAKWNASAYMEFPVYKADSKKDVSYMGVSRFPCCWTSPASGAS